MSGSVLVDALARRKHNREYMREYRRVHPEQKRDWAQKNVEHVREYQRAYREKNRERIREKSRDYFRRRGLAQYGLTVEQYDAILVAQGGGCAVCGKHPNGRRLPVDHEHETGRVRGILCDNCNRGIGRLGLEIPGRLERFAEYLQRSDT